MQQKVINLRSDNTNNACKEVIDEIIKTNALNYYEAYGHDNVSANAKKLLKDFFEKEDLEVFFVANGSASNVLLLSNYLNETNSVICSNCAHILDSESNALGFFSHGSSFTTVSSLNGKINIEELKQEIENIAKNPNPEGSLVPSVISITQLNEHGCIYSEEEVKQIAEMAKSANLKLHIDGARFLYTVAKLNKTPAELTWKLGVDAISLGFTKLGGINAEAIVFFNKKDVKPSFKRMLKRSGHMAAKTQFIAAQVNAILSNNTYKKLAENAILKAKQIADGVKNIEGVNILYNVDANHVFLEISNKLLQKLQENNVLFYTWEGNEQKTTIRLVCSFTTSSEDVSNFLQIVKKYS